MEGEIFKDGKESLERKNNLHYNKTMHSTYILNTDELTSQFITNLQQNFPQKRIEIFVQEVKDETEYLLEDPVLLKAVSDIKEGKNLVSVSIDSLL